MSNVLLLLNDKFVTLPEGSSIIINQKQTISSNHPSSTIDQFVLSNIALGNVSLQANHYDYIYYIDETGSLNPTLPNIESIKLSLKATQSVSLLNKPKKTKVGSKLSSLKFKKLNKASSPTPSLPDLVPPSSSPIDTTNKLRYFSDDSDDDELINEEELIESSLNTSSIICLREPVTNGKKRRKACKDCTCGLAEKEAFGFDKEEEEEEELPKEKPKIQFSSQELSEIDFTIQGKTGGCGSCALGDAFRCSGCPFLGMPAFKPGQAITLDGIDDDL